MNDDEDGHAMMARSPTFERIDSGLFAIECALDDLPEVVEEWDTMAEGERVSWSLDWDHLMGTYLVVLDEQFRIDAMTEKQRGRYTLVLDRLREALPTIYRSNLHRPTVSLE